MRGHLYTLSVLPLSLQIPSHYHKCKKTSDVPQGDSDLLQDTFLNSVLEIAALKNIFVGIVYLWERLIFWKYVVGFVYVVRLPVFAIEM